MQSQQAHGVSPLLLMEFSRILAFACTFLLFVPCLSSSALHMHASCIAKFYNDGHLAQYSELRQVNGYNLFFLRIYILLVDLEHNGATLHLQLWLRFDHAHSSPIVQDVVNQSDHTPHYQHNNRPT